MSVVNKVKADLTEGGRLGPFGPEPARLPADAEKMLMFVVADLVNEATDAELITLDSTVLGGYRALLEFLRSRYGNHVIFEKYLGKFAAEGR